MGKKAFKKLHFPDQTVRKLQSNVENALAPIINSDILDGVLLKNVDLRFDRINEINHGLGRAPQGWIIVRLRGDSRIWDVQDSNNTKQRTLSLRCTTDVEVDMWIF